MQACSNAQQFLSQNLDDALKQFVVSDTSSSDEIFNEALQSDCDCRQWAFQFLQPRPPTPVPTLPMEDQFQEHGMAHGIGHEDEHLDQHDHEAEHVDPVEAEDGDDYHSSEEVVDEVEEEEAKLKQTSNEDFYDDEVEADTTTEQVTTTTTTTTTTMTTSTTSSQTTTTTTTMTTMTTRRMRSTTGRLRLFLKDENPLPEAAPSSSSSIWNPDPDPTEGEFIRDPLIHNGRKKNAARDQV